MKKLLIVLFVLVFSLSSLSLVYASEIASPTSSRILIDGKQVSFDAYNINGNNYFKLRDIAYSLLGSDKQFNVTWDGNLNAVNIFSNSVYEKIGGEMALSNDNSKKSCDLSIQKFYLNSKECGVTAYLINGNNYLKLRDLGKLLDFGVTWDNNTQTILIETSKGYVEEVKEQIDGVVVDNIYVKNTHNKYVSNWASVSSIQQFKYKDLGVGFAYVNNNSLEVVLPNGSLTINMLYPILGDVIADEDGCIYIIWGKNGDADTNEETVFISKYTDSGILVKTVGFVGKSRMGDKGNTKNPFKWGNCRSAIHNDTLVVNYARQMYNEHQSNSVIKLNINKMTPIEVSDYDIWDVPYCSHSFNQDVIWSENRNEFVYVNHGDAYDRGIVIHNDNGTSYVPFHCYLQSNASYDMSIVNKTFAQLGGIEEIDDYVFLVGSSAKSISEAANTEKQNLFVQIFKPNEEVNKNNYLGGVERSGNTSYNINDINNSPLTPVTDYGVRWLTDYTDKNVIAPQIVKAEDKIVILWSTENESFYTVLNSNGDTLVPVTSLGNKLLNSYEKPIYHNGKVYWVYSGENKINLGSISIK